MTERRDNERGKGGSSGESGTGALAHQIESMHSTFDLVSTGLARDCESAQRELPMALR